MNEALRPSNIFTEFSSLDKDESEKDIEIIKDEDEKLAHTARTEGWELIKEIANEQIAFLDKMVISSMEMGASFEDIGKKTAVKEITKDVLNRIISRVEEAREASDKRTIE